jgi:hypothetical protein
MTIFGSMVITPRRSSCPPSGAQLNEVAVNLINNAIEAMVGATHVVCCG